MKNLVLNFPFFNILFILHKSPDKSLSPLPLCKTYSEFLPDNPAHSQTPEAFLRQGLVH